MSSLTGIGLAEFAKSKIGTPYVYGAKGSDGVFTNKKFNFLRANYPRTFTPSYIAKVHRLDVIDKKVCTDCSGLISWYTGKVLGSSQMYSSAYTRLPMNELDKFAIGTVLWKSGHVGVYVGKDSNGRPVCIEAKGIDYGTVSGIITNPNRWTCGLTFSYIDYSIKEKITDLTWKGTNPYKIPSTLVKKGTKGEIVKWLQWELNEAGFSTPFAYGNKVYSKVKIDGEFGPITEAALRLFQASAKLKVDGICGPKTIKALLLN